MTKNDDYYTRKYRNAPYGGLTVLALLMLTMIFFSQAHGATLQDRVIENSAKYLKVRELHNNNRSPDIDRWLKYLDLPMGQPYCAAFYIWNYHEQGNNLPRIGRCSLLWQACRARELTYKTFDAEAVSVGIEKIKPGDGIIWRHGRGTISNFSGHAGIALAQINRASFRSREGNTQPGNVGNQREGGGVYDRSRRLDIGSAFEVVGFIRVR
jgi:hypothetical protein